VPIFARIAEPEIKERLKDQTDLAQESGIFGAPSFMVGEELFWGNDRMEQALELARRG
jgi:2-hydroxychromene-2-carboxylate isomerase